MTLPIRSAQDAKAEALGPFTRQILFAPSLGNSRYMRMAIVTGPPGTRSPAHTHPGNEAIYTVQGEIMCAIAGGEYRVGSGHAIVIPPDTPHPGSIMSDMPWISICFYCDECPALAAYRAGGGTARAEQPRVVSAEAIAPEQLGELRRRILFTPSRDGINYLRLGVAEGPVGAKGAVHKHLGNECFYTLRGQATLVIGGEPHVMNAGSGMSIPPDTEHPLTSTGAETWNAVAAYCDECQALGR